jgi:uncharacterized protein YegP (UPF0339 family)
MPKFEVYQDAVGEWRWRLKASNGQVVASGEGYKSKAGAKRGCEALQRAAKLARMVLQR